MGDRPFTGDEASDADESIIYEDDIRLSTSATLANVDASFMADADGSSYVIFLRRNRRPPILQTAGTPP